MFIKDVRILFFYLNTPIDNLQNETGFFIIVIFVVGGESEASLSNSTTDRH